MPYTFILFFHLQTLDDNETLSLLDRYRYLDLVPCTPNELGCMGYKVSVGVLHILSPLKFGLNSPLSLPHLLHVEVKLRWLPIAPKLEYQVAKIPPPSNKPPLQMMIKTLVTINTYFYIIWYYGEKNFWQWAFYEGCLK